MSDAENLKSYISKLNDRNLQRKRESGITIYVLITILIICSYKLFKHSESLLITTYFDYANLNKSIALICFTFNTIFCLGSYIYYLFPNYQNFSNLRLLKKNKIEEYAFVSMFLAFPLSIILIVYTFFTFESKDLFFYVYCVYIFLLSLFGNLIAIFLLKNNSEAELIINNGYTKQRTITAIMFILSIITSVSSVYLIYNLQLDYKTEIIKITILTYITYVIIERILLTNSNDNYNSKLEDFEFEINIKKMSNEEIKDEFQSKFSGFFIKQWVGSEYKKFTDRKLKHEEDLNYLLLKISELQNSTADLLNEKFILENEFLLEKIKNENQLYKDENSKHYAEIERLISRNYNEMNDEEKKLFTALFKLINSEK